MPTDPLTPDEVDALLRPDRRAAAADLLVLRDALRRLGDAWARLAAAAARLEDVAHALERRDAGGPVRSDVPRPRPAPPRAD